jgi:hypothetical protein
MGSQTKETVSKPPLIFVECGEDFKRDCIGCCCVVVLM